MSGVLDRAPRRAGRLEALDGLRILAAVAVVVHHAAGQAGPDRTGWFARYGAVADAGVAVFFVLSGFVIWRPFVAAVVGGTDLPPVGRFLWRRLLRVVPAYWVALTFFWAVGAIHISSFGVGVRLYLLAETTSPSSFFTGIVPAWTLNVEVSFYLLTPLIAWGLRWLVRRTGSRAALWWGLAALAAIGPVSRWAFTAFDRSWGGARLSGMAFGWLPTSIDIFCVGIALAFAATSPLLGRFASWCTTRTGLCWAAGAAALGVYATFIGTPEFETGYVGWHWQARQLFYGFVGLCFVAGAATDRPVTWTARAAASSPAVWLGSVSYGLYLYHFDWIRLAARDLAEAVPGMPAAWGQGEGNSSFVVLLAAGLVLGLLSATMSRYLLEDRVQRLALRRRPAPAPEGGSPGESPGESPAISPAG